MWCGVVGVAFGDREQGGGMHFYSDLDWLSGLFRDG